jgi:uncharacterized protein
MKSRVRCPNCGREVSPENRLLPFCSERCRLLDLGRWLDAEYRIPEQSETPSGQSAEQDQDADTETED